ncbi:4-hydroxy-3-methylbut-2-enyl diphosphate reductase [Raoultibacter phocaeensis]|uniref:4-hydroxy-3-methylbut-2-enyl diphosphate reductase n=1 Tax=Raoultibacter phocaeensis TaxID=2479841 RepID=UPI0011192A24|nr:4-hydroxy-3-methylbut-2-enyl diphosphate reductase [Raoultibacter phocaeensis]
MKVIRARHAGACYGVQRALDMAYAAICDGSTAYTLGPLIHNPQVVAELKQRGVGEASSLDDIAEGIVIIRSHGVVPQVKQEAERKGLPIIDATCPHVARAQKAASSLAEAGYHVIAVGEAGHPEVEGMKAHAEITGKPCLVVATPDELPEHIDEPVGIVVQTTQAKEALDAVVDELLARGIEPQVKNTICFATRQRQEAAAELAEQVDALVVIGGRNSSNTTRLYDICKAVCPKSYHVEVPDEIDPAWFCGCAVVGVTAGASTPEDQIAAVIERLETL